MDLDERRVVVLKLGLIDPVQVNGIDLYLCYVKVKYLEIGLVMVSWMVSLFQKDTTLFAVEVYHLNVFIGRHKRQLGVALLRNSKQNSVTILDF